MKRSHGSFSFTAIVSAAPIISTSVVAIAIDIGIAVAIIVWVPAWVIPKKLGRFMMFEIGYFIVNYMPKLR